LEQQLLMAGIWQLQWTDRVIGASSGRLPSHCSNDRF